MDKINDPVAGILKLHDDRELWREPGEAGKWFVRGVNDYEQTERSAFQAGLRIGALLASGHRVPQDLIAQISDQAGEAERLKAAASDICHITRNWDRTRADDVASVWIVDFHIPQTRARFTWLLDIPKYDAVAMCWDQHANTWDQQDECKADRRYVYPGILQKSVVGERDYAYRCRFLQWMPFCPRCGKINRKVYRKLERMEEWWSYADTDPTEPPFHQLDGRLSGSTRLYQREPALQRMREAEIPRPFKPDYCVTCQHAEGDSTWGMMKRQLHTMWTRIAERDPIRYLDLVDTYMQREPEVPKKSKRKPVNSRKGLRKLPPESEALIRSLQIKNALQNTNNES